MCSPRLLGGLAVNISCSPKKGGNYRFSFFANIGYCKAKSTDAEITINSGNRWPLDDTISKEFIVVPLRMLSALFDTNIAASYL